MEHSQLVAAVREALADHPCRFDIDESVVTQLVIMLETVGEGSIQRGIQRCLKNHEWLVERRKRDDEYTKNHAMVTDLRVQAEVVGSQCKRGFMWLMLILAAACLLLAAKLGLIKAG